MDSLVISSINNDEGYYTKIKTATHNFDADEPESLGGTDEGPTPMELTLGALGSCTAITLKMYLKRKEADFEQLDVHIKSEVKKADESELSDEEKPFLIRGKIRFIYKKIYVTADMDDKLLNRLGDIAGKCPVNLLMNRNAVMKTEVIKN